VVAREFQSSIEQMIRDSELEEARKELEKATSVDIGKEIEHSIDPKGEMTAQLAEPATGIESSPPAATQSESQGAATAALPAAAAPEEAAPTAPPEKAPTPV